MNKKEKIEKTAQAKSIDNPADLWEYEKKWHAQGKQVIAGTDEAGRGPLAGPVVAAAVIFPLGIEIPGMNDSKKLTQKKREQLFDVIIERCTDYAIRAVPPETIDEINILQAALLAMEQCVAALSPRPEVVLIDGIFPLRGDAAMDPIKKGDAKSFSIAAASILAKVYRDRQMLEYDEIYPEYGFKKHKGYGTRAHYEALAAHGPCPIHRRTFRLY